MSQYRDFLVLVHTWVLASYLSIDAYWLPYIIKPLWLTSFPSWFISVLLPSTPQPQPQFTFSSSPVHVLLAASPLGQVPVHVLLLPSLPLQSPGHTFPDRLDYIMKYIFNKIKLFIYILLILLMKIFYLYVKSNQLTLKIYLCFK